MRIAVPTTDERFCPHFGRCAGVWLCEYDQATDRIDRPRIVQRPHQGCDSLPGWLKDMAVDLVIAGGIGAGAIEGLTAMSITVSAGHGGDDFKQLVASYREHPEGLTANVCDSSEHDRHHCRH